MTRLAFDVVGAEPERFAAVPSLGFRLRIAETSGQAIQAIALRSQIVIEPRRRHYTATEEELLFELFGAPARWGDTLQTLLWANTSMIVPAFTGSTEAVMPMVCTYDFEVAATKYLHALRDGHIALRFLFSGSVFSWTPSGVSIDQVPWNHEAEFEMPVATWRTTMDRFFPDQSWIRMRRETLDALVRYRGTLATTSWDDAIRSLLDASRVGGAVVTFSAAQQVADTVLYEGYALYPYRASSSKNQVRWQFGVIAPRTFADAHGSERWWIGTECLVQPDGPTLDPSATVEVRVRCLQLQSRVVERIRSDGTFEPTAELLVDGSPMVSWDEAIERTIEMTRSHLADLARRDVVLAIALPSTESVEMARDADGAIAGRVIRRTEAVSGTVTVKASGSIEAIRLGVRIENTTPWAADEVAAAGRAQAIHRSLVGVHTLLAVRGASFVSLTDPPPHLAPMAAACANEGAWPVLCGRSGDADVMLASPIILPDHPAVAPESPGDLFDATEIDEILTLRIMTLTDEEKREAGATDERARRIIERSDSIPQEVFERLHGAIRSIGAVDRGSGATGVAAANGSIGVAGAGGGPGDGLEFAPFDPYGTIDQTLDATKPAGVQADRSVSPTFVVTAPSLDDLEPSPFWEPDARVAPELATVRIGDVEVGRGARVRLRPGPRGDTMDTFIAGSMARVEAVFESVDDEVFVAVTVEVDPASEMHSWQGRYAYFRPVELEVVDGDELPAPVTEPTP